MVDISYEQAFERKWNRQFSLKTVLAVILEQTGKPKEEIIKKHEQKILDLRGLISQTGAMCIIAKELGVELFQ